MNLDQGLRLLKIIASLLLLVTSICASLAQPFNEDKYLLDTIYQNYWIEYDSAWSNYFDHRIIYSYDCNYNLFFETQQRFEGFPENPWTNISRNVFDYDNKGNQIESSTQIWDEMNQIWVYSYLLKWEKDGYGNTIELKTINWDRNSGEILYSDHTKYLYQYTTGKISEQIIIVYDTMSNSWLNSTKSEFEYLIDDSLTVRLKFRWNQNTWNWLIESTDTTFHDSHNNLEMKSYYNWDTINMIFIPSSRSYQYYNECFEFPESSQNQSWDTVTEQFAYNSWWGREYDQNCNEVVSFYRIWDNNDWISIREEMSILNDSGWIESKYDSYYWDGEFQDSATTDYTYDLARNKYNATYQRWNFESERMENVKKEEYVFTPRDSIELVNLAYQEERICLATVSNNGKNLIVWEKTPDVGTKYYTIYRESGTTGDYIKIGEQSFESLSIFVDNESDPGKQAYRYKIATADRCGVESDLSPYHKTIHLQINKGIGTYNLFWDNYKDEEDLVHFTSFKILRGFSPDNLIEIGSVSANNFTFTDGSPSGDKLYYRIAGILTDPCYPSGSSKKADSVSYIQAMSNIETSDTTTEVPDFEQNSLFIYPNPLYNSTTIQLENPEGNPYSLYIMDLTGKVCRLVDNITTSEYVLEKGDLKEGFYFVELRGPKVYRGKIVIE